MSFGDSISFLSMGSGYAFRRAAELCSAGRVGHPPLRGLQFGKVSLMWKQVVLLAVMFTSVVGVAGTVSDIEGRSSWRCKHDEGTRGSSDGITALVDSPSRDGQARRFDVSWSANGGERCSTPLGVLDTTSTYYTYDVWWYITDLSHVNNLEFDLNQVLPNRETIIYGTQCSFRLGRWKYTTREGGKARWNTSNPTCSRREWTANTWHHLVLQFHRDESGVVTYDSVTFDGSVQAFNDASGPSNFALRWYPPGLQVVNFQIGGDDSSQGTTAYLDSFSVTGSAEPVFSRLTVPVH